MLALADRTGGIFVDCKTGQWPQTDCGYRPEPRAMPQGNLLRSMGFVVYRA